MKAQKKPYSLTRYTFSVIWMFSAFLIAQLADGYQFSIGSAFIFCAVMGMIAGKIKSAIALGAYVGFSILLSHFVIATYSLTYSSDRFFPSFWGPLDLLLLLMMWSAPLLVLLADAFDSQVSNSLSVVIFKALVIIRTPLVAIEQKTFKFLFKKLELWSNQIYLGANVSRAPPSLVA